MVPLWLQVTAEMKLVHFMYLFHATSIINVSKLFLFLASALDPRGFFESKIGKSSKAKHSITCAIRRLSPSPSKASAAIDQYVLFRKHGMFVVGDEARRSALSGRLSAGDYLWYIFATP